MHILIAVITALGGLAWALVRLQNSGVDLNSFNPFYWVRRRKWAKKYGAKPLHTITHPMEAASALVVAMAHLKGPLAKEDKESILNLFINEFKIDSSAASELYTASSHLVGDSANISAEVKHVLAPTISEFREHHIESLLSMLKIASELEGHANAAQNEMLKSVDREFQLLKRTNRNW